MAGGKVKLTKKEELLKRIYFDPNKGGSFSGLHGLFKAAVLANKNKRIKITPGDVREFLENNDVHTLHKPIKRRFKRRRVYMGRPWEQWQVDLVDMRVYKDQNTHGWILMCIDIFTKMAYAAPVRTKMNDDVIAGFKTILAKIPKEQWPEKIQSDKGKEFLGEKVQQWAKSQGFKWFTSEDDYIKACIVERLNRTIKEKMAKVAMAKGDDKWEKRLDEIINGYNNSIHSSIKMKPVEANSDDPEIVARVFNNLNGPGSRLDRGLKREVLKPAADMVKPDAPIRLGRTKHIFEKGYAPNFTKEVFQVKDVVGTFPQVYHTVGQGGPEDTISGTFYPTEVQKVGNPAKRRKYYHRD